jgi:hypothetical protein
LPEHTAPSAPAGTGDANPIGAQARVAAAPLPRSIILQGATTMNNIVYIVGAVVIVLAILSFIGLR